MPEFQSGASAAVIIDARDESRLSNKANMADGREAQEDTTFLAPAFAKEFAYGLMSGTAGVGGYLALDAATIQAQMSTVVGRDRKKRKLLFGPAGLQVGYEANWFNTLVNQLNIETSVSTLRTVDMSYALDRMGVTDGLCLHAPHGALGGLGANEVDQFVVTNADPNQFFGFRAFGTSQIAEFRLADYADDNALCAAIKTKLQGLAAYAGRIVTVTVVTPRSGATLLSLVLRIEFNGAVDVPSLEVVSGAVDTFTVTGGNVNNYTSNGGAVFNLGITEANYQTNQRNIGGQFANVVSKGSSAAAVAGGLSTKAQVLPAANGRTASAVGADGKIYQLGGWGFDSIICYDPVANTVVTKTAVLDQVREGCGAAQVNGKIYLLGGEWFGGTPTAILEYNPVNDTIATKTATFNNSANGHCLVTSTVAVNNKIYAIGATIDLNSASQANRIAIYNPTTDTMSYSNAVFPQTVHGTTAIAVGTLIYVFGGFADGNVDTMRNKVYVYDTVADTITNKTATLPTGCGGMNGFVSGTRIYLFGGSLGTTANGLTQIIYYDTSTDSFTNTGATMPVACAYATSGYTNGNFYILGGQASHGASYSNAIRQYSLPSAGTATFKSYFSVAATPAAPAATGTGAAAARSVTAGTLATSIITNTTISGGSAGATYNLVTTSGTDSWVDLGSGANVGYWVRSHILSVTAGTLTIEIEHCDANANTPNEATKATLASYPAQNAAGVPDDLFSLTATTKRFVRVKYTLSAGATAIFAVGFHRR